MNSGLMVRFSSSRWQVPQVLPFPLNCSLKKSVLPWFIRVSRAVSDPPSPLPPPSGITLPRARSWDQTLDQAIPLAAVLGGLRRSRTWQVHIGELPKLPALAAPIETVEERRRSHQNTFFCRILVRACYDVKIRVEVLRMLCPPRFGSSFASLPGASNCQRGPSHPPRRVSHCFLDHCRSARSPSFFLESPSA